MVVQNDETVIELSLESIKDCIDCICIYDRGSTDDTLILIRSFAYRTKIPLHIMHFNDNAADMLFTTTAQVMINKMGYELSFSYLLFLAPGTVLNHAEALNNSLLTEEAYSCLNIKAKWGLRQKEIFLFKASQPWSIASSFLDLSLNTQTRTTFLNSVNIAEIPQDTYITQRLAQSIKECCQENLNELFYCAQSYKALRKYEQAIVLHQQYITQSDDIEKIWFSHYMIAECYREMQNGTASAHWYLQAYQVDPSRPEPLHALASFYRKNSQNHLGYLFAKRGSQIRICDNQALWTEPVFSPYQIDEELSICAYYTPYRNEGASAANNLLLRKEVPWHVKEQTYKNLLFYVGKIHTAHQMPIQFTLPLIDKSVEEYYHPMNPSIRKTQNGYQLICRSVNYTQKGAKIFHTSDPTGIFRTRNFLLEYNSEFNLQSQKEIIEDLPRKRICTFNIEGLDDCRIFNFQDSIWFSCCAGDTNPFGNFQIVLCQLFPLTNEPVIKVKQLTPLKGPDPNRCEKNWLPFVKDGKIHLIYSFDPFVIVIPDINSGECQSIVYDQQKFDFTHFRGSAAPIAFEGGYLLLVHEVVLNDDFSRCYLHRFLFLNDELTITKISTPFFFNHQGVEYCCGMTLDHFGQQLIIPIGIEDREAYLYFVDCNTVNSMLVPLKNDPYVFISKNFDTMNLSN
ncbi:MAG TPA: hypothetical protein VGJ00_01080 [Rhabdochlamydiaceae bacterium]|jgi:tetratricopeptide (TPR) repeat protein